jgi:hypothetical protein
VAIAPRLPEHVGRFVNCKYWHFPAPIQVTGKQSRAAPNIGHGAKANPVPPHQSFEGIPKTQKKREADSAVVDLRDPAVWRRHRPPAGGAGEVIGALNARSYSMMKISCFVTHLSDLFDEGHI